MYTFQTKEGTMKGKIMLLLVSCLMALSLVLASCAPAIVEEEEAPPKVYTVCFSQIVEAPALTLGRQGFYDGMAEAGFIEGENVDYIYRNAQGDMTNVVAIAEYFVSLKPDLIVSSTTPNSQATKVAIEGTGLDQVFLMVTDPVGAGLVPSWTESAPHTTGASEWSEGVFLAQLEYILEICPEVKSIGIVYNSGEQNSIVQVDAFKENAPGLGVTIVEATVTASADVYVAAYSLVGRVDAIWIPTDTTIITALDAILKIGEENSIPVFGSDTSNVESGCVAATGIDMYAVGTRAAAMAARILKGEATPGDIPPAMAEAEEHAINPSAAERFGVTISQEIIDAADIVFE